MNSYLFALALMFGFVALLFPCANGIQEPQPQERQTPPPIAYFPLRHAVAKRAAEKLTARLGEDSAVTISFDEHTNTVIIRGNADTTKRAKEILDRLDVDRGYHYLRVIQLKRADAAKTAAALDAIMKLSAFLNDDDSPPVTADTKINCIIIYGTEDQNLQANQILRWLDFPSPGRETRVVK